MSEKTKPQKESNFLLQGSILAAAGIVVRLIGLLYRVPMTNIIGDEGMGYYSTAFNVYNIMLILSSYSLPLAVSKMISARLAKGEYRNAERVLKISLVYATIAGGIAFFITWNFADFFANSIFKTPFCIYALRTLAPTIWIMAYLGVFRGYFQGHHTMVPTALSQIFEQIINAIISVVAAGALFKIGLDSNKVYGTTGYPEAFGAAGGTMGTGAGALTALIFVFLLFVANRKRDRRLMRRDRQSEMESYGTLFGIFFMTVVPVILSSGVYNVNSVLDNGIMAYGMSATGKGDQFLKLWGIYNNKYMLLVHVPLAMANALSSSLIPALSGAHARHDIKEVRKRTGLVIRFSMLIAIPSAVGLSVLAAPITNMLFRGADNSEAVKMLLLGSAAVVFLSLSTVTNAILQGISRMRDPLIHAIISLVLHCIVLVILLYVFRMGIYAMVYANIFFAVCMCILNAGSLKRYMRYRQEIRKTFILPAISAIVMGIAAFAVYRAVSMVIHSNIVATLFAFGVAVAVYGILLIKLRALEPEEMRSMPMGTKLYRICKMLHLY